MNFSNIDGGLIELFFEFWFFMLWMIIIIRIGWVMFDKLLHIIPRK